MLFIELHWRVIGYLVMFCVGVQFTERHLQYLQVFETEEMANYLRRKKSEQKDSTESKVQKR